MSYPRPLVEKARVRLSLADRRAARINTRRAGLAQLENGARPACARCKASYAHGVTSVVVTAALVAAMLLLGGLFAARAKRRRRRRKPAREAGAFVILEDNAWDACDVDDVREPWSRLATEPVRGFCGVPSGRHRVRTSARGGNATLDFVVYPGEILAWRLDHERARWSKADLDSDTRAALEQPFQSERDVAGARARAPGWLVHLRTTLGLASSRAGAAMPRSSGDAAERVREGVAKLVARAESDDETSLADLVEGARGLGEAIIGRHLTRRDLRLVLQPAREAATRLAAHGDADRAMTVVNIGFAVLPGDPELMVVAASALASRGEIEEAMRAIEAALERDQCLEADVVARAMRARMELKTRLGRAVRV